jgi:hypothetical protein
VTLIEFEVPFIEALTASVAVTVSVPTVFNVTEKVPAPPVNIEFPGNKAWGSVLVKCTVPA